MHTTSPHRQPTAARGTRGGRSASWEVHLAWAWAPQACRHRLCLDMLELQPQGLCPRCMHVAQAEARLTGMLAASSDSQWHLVDAQH